MDYACNYVGIEYPADDAACLTIVAYSPPVDNFMSDALVRCRTTFSCEQFAVMSWVARNWRTSSIIGVGDVCIGNLSGDCAPDETVDQLDLIAVLDHWGAPGGIWDLDQSGVVGIVDLLIVLESWGPC